MSPKVVIVGLPAAGKTTAGRRLAKRLAVPFADSDALVLQATGRTVVEIFDAEGEAAFRAYERDAIVNALQHFDGVLALGGGAVLSAATRDALRLSGVSVAYLVTTAEWALRFVGNARSRPLLREDAAGRLAELERTRAPLYDEVATARVSSAGRTIAQVVDDLAAILDEQGSTT